MISLQTMPMQTRSAAKKAATTTTTTTSTPTTTTSVGGQKRKTMHTSRKQLLDQLSSDELDEADDEAEEEEEEEEEEEDHKKKQIKRPRVQKTKKIARKKAVASPKVQDDSDLSDSDDDEEVQLTPTAQLGLLQAKMKKRLPVYQSRQERTVLQKEGHRKTKAALRVKSHDKRAKIQIGNQRHRLEAGRGYKVEAGGNADTRPKGVKEPKSDYKNFFETMKTMGSDPNAATLFEEASGKKLSGKDGTLADSEIAEIILHYMNDDAAELQGRLKETSDLSVHLSKLTSIFELAERSRSMEAEEPFDAVDLIKGTLSSIKKGDHTLQEGFYQGKGGADSIFIGAPSKTHSKDGIGGAEVLRHPSKYPDRIKRQMGVFPKNKKQFKKAINGNRGKQLTKDELTPTADELEQLEAELGVGVKKKVKQ